MSAPPLAPARTASRALVLVAAAVVAVVAGGCAHPAPASAPPPPPPAVPAAATSLATAQAVWAAVPMGEASGTNLFWQLFHLAPGQRGWTLATPPGVSTNGALLLTGATGDALTAAVRPSLYLTFSPVSSTTDGGHSWTPAPPAPALAASPDALAAAASGQPALALTRGGRVQAQTRPSGGWATLATLASVAATPAGHACRLTSLTAVAGGPAGIPLVAGDCGHAGMAGIFARSGGGWRPAGPALPAAFARHPVRVLRLTSAAGVITTVLASAGARSGGQAETGGRGQAGAGREAAAAGRGAGVTEVVAAWRAPGGRWTLSPALPVTGGAPPSASFGVGGAVAITLPGHRAATLSGPGASWQVTPPLPAARGTAVSATRTVTLAFAQPGTLEALAPAGGTLSVWRLAGGRWALAQRMTVPLQIGSSG